MYSTHNIEIETLALAETDKLSVSTLFDISISFPIIVNFAMASGSFPTISCTGMRMVASNT